MTDPVAAPARLLTPRFLVVVTCGLCYFLALAMLTPVLPHYVEDSLGAGSFAVGVAVGAFAVGAIALRTYAGRVGDRIGRRVLIIGGALIVAASTVVYGVVHALWWLVFMRVVTGFGEAGFFVGAATMITDLSPVDRRGEAVSYWSVAVYGGLSFGPALGEYLRGTSRYELTFVVSALLALAAALVGVFTVEVPREITEPASKHLLHRSAIKPGTVLFLGLIPLAGFSAFMPLYATHQLDIDSGPIFLLYGILILVVRIVGARVPDRLGGRDAGAMALALAAVGIGVVAAWPTVAGLVVGTAVLAAGMSLMYPALLLLALVGVGDADRASVVGTFSSFFDASQGVGAFICGAVVAVSGNRGAFTTGAVAAALGLVLLRARSS
ncbi:MAG: MFS transporter [Actinomycetota bacterium]|nr:MFS transporter [Actinomycetota bacterium]